MAQWKHIWYGKEMQNAGHCRVWSWVDGIVTYLHKARSFFSQSEAMKSMYKWREKNELDF